MKGFMIRGWGAILPRGALTLCMSPGNQRSASGVGVSTPCGAVSTREKTIFVPGVSEL